MLQLHLGYLSSLVTDMSAASYIAEVCGEFLQPSSSWGLSWLLPLGIQLLGRPSLQAGMLSCMVPTHLLLRE
jgi:hypothetical protein